MQHQGPAPHARTGAQGSLIALCFVANMVDGFDILMIGFVGPLLLASVPMDRAALGMVISAGFVGTVLGSVLFGRAADRLGRRRTLLLALASFGSLTLACVLVRSAWDLALLRFAAGLGMGGAMPVIAAIVAARGGATGRHAGVTLSYLGMPCGVVVGGSLAAALMPRFGWMSVFLMSGAAALALLLPVRLMVPADSEAAARRAPRGEPAAPARAPAGTLLGDGRAGSALALWTTSFVVLVLGGFLISFIPTLLAGQGMAPGRAALGAVVFNLGAIAGGVSLAAAARRREPFGPAALALVLACALTALLGNALGHGLAVFGWLFALGACLIGGELAIPAMASRLFPDSVRAGGVGWTLAVGRVGSIVGPAAGGWLLQSGMALPRLFACASLLPLAGAFAAWLAWRMLPGSPRQR